VRMCNLPPMQPRVPGQKNDTRVIKKAGDELLKRGYEQALVCLSNKNNLDVIRGRQLHCKMANNSCKKAKPT